MYEISVSHSIDAGHRVVGHEDGKGKCARLHGHTYLFTVTLSAPALSGIGFVSDFGLIKSALDEWDHRMVLWGKDPLLLYSNEPSSVLEDSGIVEVPFNPTAENMARHFAERFAELDGVNQAMVEVRETPKTVARYTSHAEQFQS